MNILFIDYSDKYNNRLEKNLHKYLGYFLRKYENNYYLVLNRKIKKYKGLKVIFKALFKRKEIYVVKSKKVDYLPDMKDIRAKFKNITEQNNLLVNDNIYIENFLHKIGIEKYEARVLYIIDELNDIIKEKIENAIKEYRQVDILVTRTAQYFYTLDFVTKIDEEYGTTTQTLDKLPKMDYNILLVFSNKDFNITNKSSFILDYNNSDLDVNSNAYKFYLRNKEKIKEIFDTLDMVEENYWKTKLGKIYIYENWDTLDI